MADFNQWQLINGIKAVLDADATLIADTLLGPNKVFGGEHIAATPATPFLLLRIVDDAETDGDDFYGDFRVILQIDISGPQPSLLSKILGRLDALLNIPHQRTAEITWDGGRIRSMQRRSAPMIGPFLRENDQQKLQQIASTWQLKVTQVP